MPTASPSTQPQVITLMIYFLYEMLNGLRINWTPSVCDWSCTVEVMIEFFIVHLNISKLFYFSLLNATFPSNQSADMR